jgi:hypothetical protein
MQLEWTAAVSIDQPQIPTKPKAFCFCCQGTYIGMARPGSVAGMRLMSCTRAADLLWPLQFICLATCEAP